MISRIHLTKIFISLSILLAAEGSSAWPLSGSCHKILNLIFGDRGIANNTLVTIDEYFDNLVNGGLQLNSTDTTPLSWGDENRIRVFESNGKKMVLRINKFRDYNEGDLAQFKLKEKYGGNRVYGLVKVAGRRAIAEAFIEGSVGFRRFPPTVRHCVDIRQKVIKASQDGLVLWDVPGNFFLTLDGRVVLHDVHLIRAPGTSFDELLKINAAAIFPKFIENCLECEFLRQYL